MFKQKRFWAGIVVSLALLGVLFYQTDLAGISKALASARYIYLLPALVLYFIGVTVRAERWHFLLRSIKPISFTRLFTVVVIGYMANDLLPARIGEFVRAFILGQQEGISKTSAFVTIALERIFDGLTMLAFIVIASFFLSVNEYLNALFLFVAVLFVVVLVFLILVATQRERFDPLVDRLLAHLPGSYGARAVGLFDSFVHGLSVLRNPLDAVIAFALSVLAWLFEAGMYATLALGFGIFPLAKLESVASFFVYILATAAANLVTIFPSTPSYIGVFDAPVAAILNYWGIDKNLAASYTLVLHTTLVVPVVLLGLFFAARAGMSLGQLSRRAARVESNV